MVEIHVTEPVSERHRNGSARQQSLNDSSGAAPNDSNDKNDILYGVEDTPPWYLIVFLGFQQYLTMFGSTVAVPLLITPAMCFGTDYVSQSEVIGTIFFVSGIATLLQTTFGVRLPIVQGATFAFLAPTFAILNLPKWDCTNVPANFTGSDRSEIWEPRMREIQGAVIMASLFQILVGFTGLVGLLLRFIGPITIASTISLVGLALFDAAADFSGQHWWIALLTVISITMFSQYLRDIHIPCLSYSKSKKRLSIEGYKMFKMFPVVLGIGVSWILCFILTKTDVFEDNPKKFGYHARTDTKMDVLTDSKWFRFPYPGQWGKPTVSTSAVFGMLSGVLASLVESLGDYYAAARLSGAKTPPVHAINRGIFIEGIGCVLAGIWGSGNGTTSYSENVGAIGITKVASRSVIQTGAVLMILFGMFGKFGAFFVTIPDPIVGGVFMVMFGTVFAVGVSNLQFVDLNSGRNLYIYGFSIIFGLGLPKWMNSHPGVIDTGNDSIDQILTVLCSTSMFIGGVVAAVLDNTIPGTLEERGMIEWNKHISHDKQQGDKENTEETYSSYDLPFGIMRLLRRLRCTRWIPICPTFTGWPCEKDGASDEHIDRPIVLEGVNGKDNGVYWMTQES